MNIVELQVLEWKQVDGHRARACSGIVFASIFLIEVLINCNNAVDYVRLVTQKAASGRMMDLDAEEVMFVIKIIDLDAEVFAEKAMVAFFLKLIKVVFIQQ